MSEQKNQKKTGFVPRLRFPEFRDAGEWTTKKLAHIAELIGEKAGQRNLTLMSITAGVGLVSQVAKFGREIAGEQKKNYYVIKHNDFAYNKSATKDYPEGYVALYEGNVPAAVPNSIFICFRVKENEVVPRFLNYQFLDNLHGRWLQKFITVGARAHGSLNIDNKDLLALPVPLTTGQSAILEQQKIADCLSSLDTLIAAQTEKIDALKHHKKGLMQQLFPREGETVPRLRFLEFRDAGEWDPKHLEKLCDNISSGKDRNDPEGIYDLYGSTGVIGKTASNSFRGEYILVARVGANAGMLTKSKGEFGVTDNTLVLQLKNPKTLDFVYYWLDKTGLNKLIFGSGQPLVTGKQLKDLELCFPVSKEQQKIADCLSSLDTLITAHREKLDALNQHKKGLMQQLFPSPDAVGV